MLRRQLRADEGLIPLCRKQSKRLSYADRRHNRMPGGLLLTKAVAVLRVILTGEPP